MIVKIVEKEFVVPGEYFHEMQLECDRVEVQFHKSEFSGADDAFDWTYTDQQVTPQDGPVYVIRTWNRWPSNSFEVGVVRSGRIFLVNSEGKTTDKYII